MSNHSSEIVPVHFFSVLAQFGVLEFCILHLIASHHPWYSCIIYLVSLLALDYDSISIHQGYFVALHNLVIPSLQMTILLLTAISI